jgi:hypothetical protein
MSDSPKIYAALQAVMADIGAIPKASQAGNEKYGFKFRGIDQVLTKLAPVLRDHKVMGPVPRVVSHHVEGNRALLVSEYAWVSLEDGSEVRGSTVGEATDNQDKASNKAMSIALKYFIIQSLCIPVEEGVLDEQEVIDSPKPKAAAPKPAPKSATVLVPLDVDQFIQEAATIEQLSERYASCKPDAEAEGWLVGLNRITNAQKAKLTPNTPKP